MKELLEAGVHFGSLTHTWNPRMKPFIHGKRNKIHIINLVHTVRGLAKGAHFLREVAATGRQIVFVGTKRHMQGLVMQEAARSEMPCVTERWLGGTLTNFRTIRARLNRLDELDKLWDTGAIEAGYSKKMKATLGRERDKIKANLSGIRKMERMPGAMFIIDTRREHIAVKEAKKLGVKTIALIDTDGDPDLIDLPIPGNDDAMRAIEIVMRELADSIIEGKQGRVDKPDSEPAGAAPRRRSTRSAFKAEDGGRAAASGEGAEGAAAAGEETPAASAEQPGEPVGAGQGA
jgi:small subunit ribosomal protein S2